MRVHTHAQAADGGEAWALAVRYSFHARSGDNVMLRSSMRRVVAVAAVASAAVVATGVEPAAAADFPAGIACTFPLHIDRVDKFKVHEFTDANGNEVLLITDLAGLTLTNTETGASLKFPATGTVAKIVTTADGRTTTFTVTGHELLILYPTDVPAGPSTTAYVGRVVFTIDNLTGVFTLQEAQGTATDLCAALSG